MADEIRTRLEDVRSAITDADEMLGGALAASSRAALFDAERRYSLVGDHTVAALVGGTGSGKSSLFNALTQTRFADAGYIRPSTRRASACAWGVRADELLDHLGVEPARRILRDTELDHSGEKGLTGLVLLDLPDHDSVEETHWVQVDRLLPVVDLLIWVVDPQKYADHLLHERYLRTLKGRADAMLVVVNQIDTVSEDGREAILADVRQLLDDDDLAEVPVIATCAEDGEGIDELRDYLLGVVADESTAHATARAEIQQVANGIATRIGPGGGDLGDAAVRQTVDELLEASGIGAVADSIRRAASRPAGGALAHPEPPARATVAAIGSTWAGRAKEGLSKRWAARVDEELPGVETLLHSTTAAVDSVPLPRARVNLADYLAAFGLLIAVAGIVLVVVGVSGENPALWGGGIAAFVVGAVMAGFSGGVRRSRAAALADGYASDVRASVESTVRAVLVEPTQKVAERHRSILERLGGERVRVAAPGEGADSLDASGTLTPERGSDDGEQASSRD